MLLWLQTPTCLQTVGKSSRAKIHLQNKRRVSQLSESSRQMFAHRWVFPCQPWVTAIINQEVFGAAPTLFPAAPGDGAAPTSQSRIRVSPVTGRYDVVVVFRSVIKEFTFNKSNRLLQPPQKLHPCCLSTMCHKSVLHHHLQLDHRGLRCSAPSFYITL